MNELRFEISIPEKYRNKFINLINNANILNKGSAEIKINRVIKKNEKYVAIPIQEDAEIVATPKMEE